MRSIRVPNDPRGREGRETQRSKLLKPETSTKNQTFQTATSIVSTITAKGFPRVPLSILYSATSAVINPGENTQLPVSIRGSRIFLFQGPNPDKPEPKLRRTKPQRLRGTESDHDTKINLCVSVPLSANLFALRMSAKHSLRW